MNTHNNHRKHGLTRRPVLVSMALTVVLSVALLAVTARAQEASPPAEGEMMELPPGVALTLLIQIAPFDLPDEPVELIVGRLTIEPGAEIPRHPHPVGEFGIVEAGSVTLRTFEGPPAQVVRGVAAGSEATVEEAGPGKEITATVGDFAVVPAGNVSDTRAGDAGVTLLVFEFAPLPAEGTPTP